MSGAPTPALWRSRDRVFRETFLWRFDEEGAELLRPLEELLLALADRTGFVPGRGHGPIPAKVLAVADDLQHLAGYLEAFRYEPRATLSPRDVALCNEAATWIGHLEVAAQALRREATDLTDAGGEPP